MHSVALTERKINFDQTRELTLFYSLAEVIKNEINFNINFIALLPGERLFLALNAPAEPSNETRQTTFFCMCFGLLSRTDLYRVSSFKPHRRHRYVKIVPFFFFF